MRIDKWLWAVRVYRTRTLAAEACRSGHVRIAGQPVKPSREVRIDETINARIGDLTKTIKVLGLTDRRVSADAAKAFAEDQTPPAEYEKARNKTLKPLFYRPKGLGRPTKKDRRAMEKLF
ncbi:MAG: RNA-binding S4 domain-containing protein [Candidatus Omnitrophica bacterium]|nr:RNA-binding S4 domain-containing protein [Candidatus Omnitrophota bacterium]